MVVKNFSQKVYFSEFTTHHIFLRDLSVSILSSGTVYLRETFLQEDKSRANIEAMKTPYSNTAETMCIEGEHPIN